MPEISRFFGIVIQMFYDDHSPAHFHARYGQHQVVIGVPHLSVLKGSFPPRAWRGTRPRCGPSRLWSRTMLPNVVGVTQTGPYRLRLRFDDGAEGEIEVKETVSFVGVFEPLRDPAFFAQVRVDSEAGTVVWPNGADLDPLVLHSRVTGVPITLDVPSAQAG